MSEPPFGSVRVPILDAADDVPAEFISLEKSRDGATRVAMTGAERAKLAALPAGATANSSDAALRDRSTHTGAAPVTAVSASGVPTGHVVTARDGAARWDPPGLADFQVRAEHLAPDLRVPPQMLGSGDKTASHVLHGDGTWRQVAVPVTPGGGSAPFSLAKHPTDPHITVLTLGLAPDPGPGLPDVLTPSTVSVSVTGTSVALSGSMSGDGLTVDRVNLGVRRKSNSAWVGSTPEHRGVTITGAYPLTGTVTGLSAGVTYEAYVAWSQDGGVTWQIGPVTEFTPAPVAPGPGPGGDGWPTNSVQMFLKIWGVDPHPDQVPPEVDVLYLAFAFGNPLALAGHSGGGPAALQATVAARRAAGKLTMLSIGGAGVGSSSTPLSNPTAQAQAVKAISDMLGGIDGVDLNYETAANLPSAAQHVAFAQAARQLIPGAYFTIPPGGQNTTSAYPIGGAMHQAGLLAQIGHQFYDTNRTLGDLQTVINRCQSNGIPVDKIAIGMFLGSEPTHMTQTTAQTWINAGIDRGIRRTYLWTESRDLPAPANTWANNMRAALGAFQR